jgi:hypothetical protein
MGDMFDNLICSGTKYYGEDGDCWTKWWLVRGKLDTEEMFDRLGFGYYRGPGRVFEDKPFLRMSKSYSLVIQRGGYDI